MSSRKKLSRGWTRELKITSKNLGMMAVSLLAAFGLWLNVASEPELATILRAPVQYKNFPGDLEISSSIVDSIDVEARGPSGLLRPDSKIAAIIDFSDVTAPGERTFTIGTNEVRLPRGIRLVRTMPAQLRFVFERRASRDIPVVVPMTGQLPEGLKLAKVEIEPPTLTIMGPESRVYAAKKAMSDPLDLSTVTESGTRAVAVFVDEPEVRFARKPQVTVRVQVEPGRRR